MKPTIRLLAVLLPCLLGLHLPAEPTDPVAAAKSARESAETLRKCAIAAAEKALAAERPTADIRAEAKKAERLALDAEDNAAKAEDVFFNRDKALREKQIRQRKANEPLIREAGEHLDEIEKQLAEWGHASISGFVLVPHHDTGPGPFDLDHNDATSNYVARIRTNLQGRAAFQERRSTSAELTGTFANIPKPGLATVSTNTLARQEELGDIEHQIRLAQLRQQLDLTQRGTNSPVTNLFSLNPAPTAGTGTNVTQIITNIVNITHSPAGGTNAGLAGFGSLLSSSAGGVGLSETAVLKLAATAKETERTLSFLSHPVNLPGNKQAFFAIATVGVFPGWRTREDYVCEVSAHFLPSMTKEEFVEQMNELPEARKIARGNLPSLILGNSATAEKAGLTPGSLSLISAFPFVESQIFDQQTTRQSRLDLLLNLAGTYLTAGFKADAEVLIKYARERQKDLVTRNALPLVVPGVDSDTLTYRFDPEASAMLEPTAPRPKGGRQLVPTSIPVLVLVVGDREDLERWSRLTVEIETRWIPRAKQNPWKKVLVDFPTRLRSRDKLISHEDSLVVTGHFDDALDILGEPGVQSSEAGKELRRRASILQTLAFGRSVHSSLPRPGPTLTRLAPSTVTQKARISLEIYGNHLAPPSHIPTTATIGGIPLSLESTNNNVLQVRFGIGDGAVPASLEPGQYDLVVNTAHGTRTWSKALTVKAPSAPEAPKPSCIMTNDGQVTHRDAFVVTHVTPTNGFFNGPTVVTLLGSGFLAKPFHDPVNWISVGGRPAQNLVVVNDRVLHFEVPAWTSSTNKLDSPFPDAAHAAEIVLSSACNAINAAIRLVFDLPAPPQPPAAKTGLDLPADLEKKLKAVIALNGALDQDVVIRGGAYLGVGTVGCCSTNSPGGGTGSPTIVNVGTSTSPTSVSSSK